MVVENKSVDTEKQAQSFNFPPSTQLSAQIAEQSQKTFFATESIHKQYPPESVEYKSTTLPSRSVSLPQG